LNVGGKSPYRFQALGHFADVPEKDREASLLMWGFCRSAPSALRVSSLRSRMKGEP